MMGMKPLKCPCCFDLFDPYCYGHIPSHECRPDLLLWRVRVTLIEIGWIARMIEIYDNGYTTGQWHLSHLIGTGGDDR